MEIVIAAGLFASGFLFRWLSRQFISREKFKRFSSKQQRLLAQSIERLEVEEEAYERALLDRWLDSHCCVLCGHAAKDYWSQRYGTNFSAGPFRDPVSGKAGLSCGFCMFLKIHGPRRYKALLGALRGDTQPEEPRELEESSDGSDDEVTQC